MPDCDRFYWFWVRSYESLDKFQPIFDHCKNYAYIYHDKDGNEPHYHFLFHLISNSTYSAFLNTYGIKMHVEICNNPLLAFEYLTHKNDPDKYQYSIDDVVALNLNKFLALSSSGNQDSRNFKTMDLLQDIINNIPLDEMVYKYGRDYVINYDKYHNFARRMSNCIQISNDEYLRLLDSVKDLHHIRSLINEMQQDTFDFSLIEHLKKM